MSIPKEPRQLMINLMYLVLTAMLALNVSAEIINAFFMIDKGLKKSNEITDGATNTVAESLPELIASKGDKYKPIMPAVEEIRRISKEFTEYVQGITDKLIDESGNRDGKVSKEDYMEDEHGGEPHPLGYKNKDVTTRVLVDGEDGKGTGVGHELEKKIAETREKMGAVVEKLFKENPNLVGASPEKMNAAIENIKKKITLEVSDDWKQSDKKSWAQFNFWHMPVAAVMPMLTKFQNDAKSTEAAIVNELAGLIGKTVIVFDSFMPIVQAEKSYIIKGETFKATIGLGASSKSTSDFTLNVNGANVPVRNGVGEYSATPGSTGEQTLNVTCTVKNPTTGEMTTGKTTFKYEVGMRSATVSADKMNVFYIGVENPVSVSVAGASSNQVQVSATGCNITGGGGKYVVTANQQGKAVVTIQGGGLPATNFEFRVKRIPDPVAKIGGKTGGAMGSGEMKAQQGIIPVLENFDFDAKCQVMGFTAVRVPKRADAIVTQNQGATFTGRTAEIINQAAPNDVYYFNDVKVRCPGDQAAREINSLAFSIR